MAKGISLIIIHDGKATDISNLVSKVVWKGRKGSAARSITATLIDDDGREHDRIAIEPDEGYSCIFSYNGEELFRGLVMKTQQDESKQMPLVAYDNGIYLSNNSDTFVYTNASADDIFLDICNRFNIPHDKIARCDYVIPELTKSNTTAWDALSDALSDEFNATGIRHYVMSKGGKLSLLTRRENILQWVIEANVNLSKYSYTKSIEKIKTRVQLLSNENTVVASTSKSALESKIGIFQEVDKADETFTAAQLKQLCDNIIDEKSTPERSLSVTALGNTEIISGIGVFIIIKHLGLSKTFYVDEDIHTFEGDKHTMSLKLNYAADVPRPKIVGTGGSGGTAAGQTVNFYGGSYYVSSTSTTPIITNANPGPCKLEKVDEGALHPYFLAHTDNKTTVYGWVDAGTFG